MAADHGKVEKSDAQWREGLSYAAYRVLRHEDTERPFSSPLNHEHRPGTYVCAGCGQALFRSDMKFDAGCGWPSFTRPVASANVTEHRDESLGMVRTEVRSAHADSHLGHVFPDGPRDRGGLRYCINSAALRFVHRDDMAAEGYGDYLGWLEENDG